MMPSKSDSNSSPSIVSFSTSRAASRSSTSRCVVSASFARAKALSMMRAHLGVDLRRDLVGVVALLADLAAEEDHLVLLAEGERPELLAHPVLGDHRAGQAGRLLDVVRAAGGRVAEDDLLGDVAAEHAGDLVLELRLGVEVSVLGGQAHRVAERHAAADDRDLGHRVALREDALHDGVAALVVGDDLLLVLGDDPAAALRPGDDAVDRLVELAMRRCSSCCAARPGWRPR